MDNIIFKNERDKETINIKGTFILKGIIHILDNNKNFEVLFEDFIYNGLESDGCLLSQSGIGVYLKHELGHYDWEIQVEVDRCYAVLFEFDLVPMNSWAEWGFEYDEEIECKRLHIIPISDEATKYYLKEEFQFEEN